MDREILDYCLSRKPTKGEGPSWEQIANEIYDKFGFMVGSISGLRSRVAEYRKDRSLPNFGIPEAQRWGDGPAELVESSTDEWWETVVFLSDIHAPYHNKPLIEATYELIRDIAPHRIVINGDVTDFFQVSRFNKAREREDEMWNDILAANAIREGYREAAPNAVIDETEGNHDGRLQMWLEINAGVLMNFPALQPNELFMWDELEIVSHPRAGFRLREHFLVEHGHIARKDAGASAKARLNDTLISGIMGHVHRLGSYRRTGYRDLVWFEQGCLCLQEPDYIVGQANWQPGIAIGMFSTRSEVFHVETVPALGNGFIYGGRVYGEVESAVAA